MSKLAVLATLLLLSTLPLAHAGDLPLTVAQVEQVTAQSGLSTQPARYDKSGTNFVTAQGATVITLKVASATMYDFWSSQPAMNDQAAYAGLGEDAVGSRKGRYICFKKAALGACVMGGVDLPGKPALATDAQLAELARLAAAR